MTAMTATSPIGHGNALELAAAAPTFPLTAAEARDLRDHLRTCEDCSRRAARMRSDLAAIGRIDPAVSPRLHDRIREIAVTQPRSGPSPVGIVLVLALLAVGVVGASIGVGAMWGSRPAVNPEPSLRVDPADAVDWRTASVELAARELWIERDGQRFMVPANPMLSSDPGDAHRWTLEASWSAGQEQRLNLYFAADDEGWWIDSIQAWDPSLTKEEDRKGVVFRTGQWAHTPWGETFAGDLDIDGVSAMGNGPGTVRVHFGDVRIAVHPQDIVSEPIGGVRKLLKENGNPAVDGNPFDRGGPLHCSGILLMAPQAAEARLQLEGYALTWRWQTAINANEGMSEPLARAPSTGRILDAKVGSSGELIVFVANPAGPPPEPPATMPADCPAP